MDMVIRKQVMIVTSGMARIEVIGPHSGDGGAVRDAFRSLFKRPSFQMVEISSAITELSGDIRVEVPAAVKGAKLQAADATFIATALAVGAEELHTFDPHMLRLDRLPCVQGLRIRKPRGSQTGLAF